MKTQTQVYKLYTYDLWSDGEGGYTVNDGYPQGEIAIKVKGKTYNEGTEHEFISFEPTDRQLNRAIGTRGVSWDGESEFTLYGESKKGHPVCELRRVK